jgi:hypothetical protein
VFSCKPQSYYKLGEIPNKMCKNNRNNLENTVKLAVIYAKQMKVKQLVYKTNTGLFQFVNYSAINDLSRSFLKVKIVDENGEVSEFVE